MLVFLCALFHATFACDVSCQYVYTGPVFAKYWFYNGSVSVTITDRPCIFWPYDNETLGVSTSHNFCRNGQGGSERQMWCYTRYVSEVDTTWEYCNVGSPSCTVCFDSFTKSPTYTLAPTAQPTTQAPTPEPTPQPTHSPTSEGTTLSPGTTSSPTGAATESPTAAPTANPVTNSPSTPSPSPQNTAPCIVSTAFADVTRNPRIVGGTSATPHEFPFFVLIRNGNKSCGASLISPQWILTAAHCIFPEPFDQYEILIGMQRSDDSPENNGCVERFKLSQTPLCHPNYRDGILTDDICLGRLNGTSLYANNTYKPIKPYHPRIFPNVPSQEADQQVLQVAGFGATEQGQVVSEVEQLQKTYVPVYPGVWCSQKYAEHNRSSQICAGYLAGSVDACLGDGGGPLFSKIGTQFYQVGLVSYGYGCAQANGYVGVYTRISYYYSWLCEQEPFQGAICASLAPTVAPTMFPTSPTRQPTYAPSTTMPTIRSTRAPTFVPTKRPSGTPTERPTRRPTSAPTTRAPTLQPTKRPTTIPTERPTRRPTYEPTTRAPTLQPTKRPTRTPTERPTRKPTSEPTGRPTRAPTSEPTKRPTKMPTERPTRKPTNEPTVRPTRTPTLEPTKRPTRTPTDHPTPK